jgi:hypothetical protein
VGMGKTTRKTKALRLTLEDLEIIATLRRYHGVSSDNEVIRMALRSALREIPPSQTASKGLAIHPRV